MFFLNKKVYFLIKHIYQNFFIFAGKSIFKHLKIKLYGWHKIKFAICNIKLKKKVIETTIMFFLRQKLKELNLKTARETRSRFQICTNCFPLFYDLHNQNNIQNSLPHMRSNKKPFQPFFRKIGSLLLLQCFFYSFMCSNYFYFVCKFSEKKKASVCRLHYSTS